MATTNKDFRGGLASATLTSAITAGSPGVGGTFTVNAATNWPDGSDGSFVVTVDRGLATAEQILCSSRSGTTLTVEQRGYAGTTAVGHTSGTSVVEHTLDAETIQDHERHVHDDTRDDHSQYLTTTRHDARDHSAAVATAVLADLLDVSGTAPTDEQLLAYDTTTGLWRPVSSTAPVVDGVRGTSTVAIAAASQTAMSGMTQAITVGSSGKLVVVASARFAMQGTIGGYAELWLGLSGANTVASNVHRIAHWTRDPNISSASSSAIQTIAGQVILTGLTAGSTTITLYYVFDSVSGSYSERTLIGIAP